MDALNQINKIQDTLKELQGQFEMLKDTLVGASPPSFSKDSLRVREHLRSIADFGKKQDHE